MSGQKIKSLVASELAASPQGCKNSGNTEVLYDGSCTVCHADQGERCIKETITFTFRNKAQQRAFHAKLKGRKREDHGAKG